MLHDVVRALVAAEAGPLENERRSDPGMEAVTDDLRARDLANRASEPMRVLEIGRRQRTDRSPRDFRELEMPPERHAHEHDELRRRIMTIDVGAGIGFRVAESLRVGEHRLHRFVRGRHATEDVVARAVENACDAGEPIAGQAFAHAVNQRHAAGNGGLEPKLTPRAAAAFSSSGP